MWNFKWVYTILWHLMLHICTTLCLPASDTWDPGLGWGERGPGLKIETRQHDFSSSVFCHSSISSFPQKTNKQTNRKTNRQKTNNKNKTKTKQGVGDNIDGYISKICPDFYFVYFVEVYMVWSHVLLCSILLLCCKYPIWQ